MRWRIMVIFARIHNIFHVSSEIICVPSLLCYNPSHVITLMMTPYIRSCVETCLGYKYVRHQPRLCHCYIFLRSTCGHAKRRANYIKTFVWRFVVIVFVLLFCHCALVLYHTIICCTRYFCRTNTILLTLCCIIVVWALFDLVACKFYIKYFLENMHDVLCYFIVWFACHFFLIM